jgi:hypothetical protein
MQEKKRKKSSNGDGAGLREVGRVGAANLVSKTL